MEKKYTESRTVTLTGGGTAKVTVYANDPINPADWPILQPGGLRQAADTATMMRNAIHPKQKEVVQ